MTQELIDLLCRVCLKQDELMVDVYEHVEEQQTDLCTLLERCGDIKVSYQIIGLFKCNIYIHIYINVYNRWTSRISIPSTYAKNVQRSC